MKQIFYRLLPGLLTGAVCGYMYYHYIGCVTGNCAITSSPVTSTLYGAMLGALIRRGKKEE